jgi:hypothetical protein
LPSGSALPPPRRPDASPVDEKERPLAPEPSCESENKEEEEEDEEVGDEAVMVERPETS